MKNKFNYEKPEATCFVFEKYLKALGLTSTCPNVLPDNDPEEYQKQVIPGGDEDF